MTSMIFVLYFCFFGLFHTSLSDKFVDLIKTIRQKNTDNQQTKTSFVSEFRDIVQTIQDNLLNSSATGN